MNEGEWRAQEMMFRQMAAETDPVFRAAVKSARLDEREAIAKMLEARAEEFERITGLQSVAPYLREMAAKVRARGEAK
jgi:hypothetical protein